VPKGVAETTPNGGFGVVLATPSTHGGGFGHPLSTLSHPYLAQGAKGVAEPPLGAQGGGYDHPHFFFFCLFFFFFFEKCFFFKKKKKNLIMWPCQD
jgi:hypothetical protein